MTPATTLRASEHGSIRSGPPGFWRRLDPFVLPATWLLAAGYVAIYVRRGWVAHDEGTIGESAERFLRGELPHRDFVDVYTGGLTMLNSVAMRWFGTSLLAPRLMLFLFALAWIPVVYWIARRFVRPPVAGVVTLVALVWGFPNYFAALPSWYNLIFATFAVAAVLRFLETGSRWWLAAAGLSVGASVLAKVTGLYLLAALLLFLLEAERDVNGARPGAASGGRVYPAFVSLGLVLFLAALLALLRPLLSAAVVYQFFVPSALVVGLIAWRQWSAPAPGSFGTRLGRLLGLYAPLLAGVALPVGIFLVPFLRSHAVADLVRGVFVLPQKRFSFAVIAAQPMLPSILAVIPPLAVLTVPAFRRVPWLVLALAAGGLLVLEPLSYRLYTFTVLMARASVPAIVGAGLVVLAKRQMEREPAREERHAARAAMLLLSVLAVCEIVQYPFSARVYFCYVAPLAVLALAAVLSLRRDPPRAIIGTATAFAGAFAVLWLNTAFLLTMGPEYAPSDQTALLGIPRGRVKVSPEDSATYSRLDELVRQHGTGTYIWAGPDASQVYFLTGKRNPTQSDYEFFDDAAGSEERLLRTLERHDVRLVAINDKPLFSPRLAPAVLDRLHAMYPHTAVVGHFLVGWQQ